MSKPNPHEQVRELIDGMMPQVEVLAKRALDNAAREFQAKVDAVFKDVNEQLKAIPGVIEGSVKPKYDNLMVQFETNIRYLEQPDEEVEPEQENSLLNTGVRQLCAEDYTSEEEMQDDLARAVFEAFASTSSLGGPNVL